MKILITGGAGFIGSALIRYIINNTDHRIINIDNLTYAGSLLALKQVSNSPKYKFVKGDICDSNLITTTLDKFQPDAVMHLAAETHVDRSIDAPLGFIHTNITGTAVLLECVRKYWEGIPYSKNFRFHHISTDEVYGSLGSTGFFTESTSYDPSSPYSASKASSDHLVRAWHRTYGLPTIITNCSNNYGPYQFPDKLIPLMIQKALEGKSLPIYGSGKNVRDWLFVEDHAQALIKVVINGDVGESYNIGGRNEFTNFEVVDKICQVLDEMVPISSGSYKDLITFVADRPGHDLRYAIDAQKIDKDLGWSPQVSFQSGLRKTISWHIKNQAWIAEIQGINNKHLEFKSSKIKSDLGEL